MSDTRDSDMSQSSQNDCESDTNVSVFSYYDLIEKFNNFEFLFIRMKALILETAIIKAILTIFIITAIIRINRTIKLNHLKEKII